MPVYNLVEPHHLLVALSTIMDGLLHPLHFIAVGRLGNTQENCGCLILEALYVSSLFESLLSLSLSYL